VRVEAKLVGSVIENGRMNRTSHDACAQNDVAIFSGPAILKNSNALISIRKQLEVGSNSLI